MYKGSIIMKNKTGKAITVLIMCIVLCTCAYTLSGCGDDFDYDYPYGNGNVKICAEHTGFGTCSVCGIDYYDALTGYIKNNGEYIDGNYVLGTKVENVILLIIYDYSDNGVTIGNTTANSDAEASTLLIMDNVSTSYLWGLTLKTGYSEYKMAGYLTASSFTDNTAMLSPSSSTFPSSVSTDAKKLAAISMRMNVIGLSTILELSETNVTVADFGFISF